MAEPIDNANLQISKGEEKYNFKWKFVAKT